jgi:hypothetical protein
MKLKAIEDVTCDYLKFAIETCIYNAVEVKIEGSSEVAFDIQLKISNMDSPFPLPLAYKDFKDFPLPVVIAAFGLSPIKEFIAVKELSEIKEGKTSNTVLSMTIIVFKNEIFDFFKALESVRFSNLFPECNKVRVQDGAIVIGV